MQSSVGEVFASAPTLAKLLAGAAFVLFLNSLWNIWKLRHIPTVGGPAIPILCYIGTFRYLQDPQEILQVGYEKYKAKPGMFKIAAPDRWLVVVGHPNLIDELQKHSDEQVSFMDAATEFVGTRYALPGTIADDPWHIPPLKQHLTHAIGSFFGDMLEELRVSIEERIPSNEKDDEWVAIPALDTFFWVFTRVIDRIIVGLPIGRDPEFIKLMVEFTMSIGIARFFIGLVPPMLKPAMAKLAARGVHKATAEAEKMLAPVIADRINIEEARAQGRPLDEIVIRTIVSIFVGMHRVDSVLRESQRVNGINSVSVMRTALQDITLTSAGAPVCLPAGTLCVAPERALHADKEHYPDPDAFVPFRFAELRATADARGGAQHQFVSTSTRYVPFGHGKHACPSRFFAGNEMKAAVAHLVSNYDVRLPDGASTRPPNELFGLAIVPNRSAKVMFRRRQPVV
uniref:Cytochrome P450 n=1 Tax=Phanerodontia chrysosporium TaxID=2822231 RepID=G5EJR7_PHACH|nr:cytochrome P450 [Phanerodontia chrysosporium]